MSTKKTIEQEWTDAAEKALKGKTIVKVRYMTDLEKKDMEWYGKALVIQLNDGTLIYPSQDEEGNDAGVLRGQTKDGKELILPTL